MERENYGLLMNSVCSLALITVSQSDTVMLHSWEADSGLMRWSAPTQLIYNDKRPLALDNNWRPGGVSAVLAGGKQGL